MSKFIEIIKNKAKKSPQNIILPESTDPRILTAAKTIAQEKFAKITILSTNKTKLNILPDAINVININNFKYLPELANKLFEIRKHKGLTYDQAKKLIMNPIYLSTILVHENLVDGMVCGAVHKSVDVMRSALQIVKPKIPSKTVSSFFIIDTKNKDFGTNGIIFFADCGMIADPSVQELSDIAIDTADSYLELMENKPKVAFLSYSTYGSGIGQMVDKIKKAVNLAQNQKTDYIIDGELQADAALIPHISKTKSPNSPIKGRANILIFPDLNSANISYKLVSIFGNCQAYGPLTQGLFKPINDLSRSCSIEEIIGVVALTAVQSQNLKKETLLLSPAGCQNYS